MSIVITQSNVGVTNLMAVNNPLIFMLSVDWEGVHTEGPDIQVNVKLDGVTQVTQRCMPFREQVEGVRWLYRWDGSPALKNLLPLPDDFTQADETIERVDSFSLDIVLEFFDATGGLLSPVELEITACMVAAQYEDGTPNLDVLASNAVRKTVWGVLGRMIYIYFWNPTEGAFLQAGDANLDEASVGLYRYAYVIASAQPNPSQIFIDSEAIPDTPIGVFDFCPGYEMKYLAKDGTFKMQFFNQHAVRNSTTSEIGTTNVIGYGLSDGSDRKSLGFREGQSLVLTAEGCYQDAVIQFQDAASSPRVYLRKIGNANFVLVNVSGVPAIDYSKTAQTITVTATLPIINTINAM